MGVCLLHLLQPWLLLVSADSQMSLQKEPSEVPTPKRPRGRPKGSKNKGTAKTRVRLLCGVLRVCWGVCGSLLIVESGVPRTVWNSFFRSGE